ncbi:MAG: hypothetical protein RLZZ59_756 [Pseudomonadota bacterium]
MPEQKLNPFLKLMKRIVTHFQKKEIYDPNDQEINMNELRNSCPEIQLLSFSDENGMKHRFLYKPPKDKDSPSIIHFGGTNLDYNDYSYRYLIGTLAKNKDMGIVIPIYPGYHDKTTKPSERKLNSSCTKIYDAVTDFTKTQEFKNEKNESIKLSGIVKKNITLVGYSLGAPLAAKVAEHSQNKGQKLILVSPPASIRDFSAQLAKSMGRIGSFLAKMSYLFGEEYNTLENLKKIPESASVSLISSDRDQFKTTKYEGNLSHIERLSNTLKEISNTNTVISLDDTKQPSYFSPEDIHMNNLTRDEILSKISEISKISPSQNTSLSSDQDIKTISEKIQPFLYSSQPQDYTKVPTTKPGESKKR